MYILIVFLIVHVDYYWYLMLYYQCLFNQPITNYANRSQNLAFQPFARVEYKKEQNAINKTFNTARIRT